MSALVLAATMAAGVSPADAWKKPAVWRGAPEVELSGVAGASAAPARVRALWNGDWLLVEFVCRDASIVSPGAGDGLGDKVLSSWPAQAAPADFHRRSDYGTLELRR